MTNTTLPDDAIAQVGSTTITGRDLLGTLIKKSQWPIVQECLDYFLISEQFLKYGIEIGQEELRTYITVFRQRHGLVSGHDTTAWLERHHMSESDFIERCQYEVKLQRLKDTLFEDKLQAYFSNRQAQLAVVELYRIVAKNEEAAKEIIASIREGASFFDYARRYSIDTATNKTCGYLGKVLIQELDPKEQELVTTHNEGEVVGPVKVAKHFHILYIDKVSPAQFNELTRDKLQSELFAQWLSAIKNHGQMVLASHG